MSCGAQPSLSLMLRCASSRDQPKVVTASEMASRFIGAADAGEEEAPPYEAACSFCDARARTALMTWCSGGVGFLASSCSTTSA